MTPVELLKFRTANEEGLSAANMYFTWGYQQRTCTSHENLCTFMIIPPSFILRMRNVSDKFVEKIRTHVLCSINFSKNRVVYELMWKYIAELGRLLMKIRRMRIA